MMKWLFYKKESKTKAKVILEYNITPPEELLKEDYVEIEEKNIPEPKEQKNKGCYLCLNPETKELWYEYYNIPKTQKDIQKENMESLAQIVAKLNLENKKKDAIATTLAQTVATLNLRLNKIEKEGR